MADSTRKEHSTLNRRQMLRLSTAAVPLSPAAAAQRAPATRTRAAASGTCSPPRTAVTMTRYGKVREDVEDGVSTFKGVPCGTTTASENRGLPAQPPTPWDGERPTPIYGSQLPAAPARLACSHGGGFAFGSAYELASQDGAQQAYPHKSIRTLSCMCSGGRLTSLAIRNNVVRMATMTHAQGTGKGPGAEALARKTATARANVTRTGTPSRPGLAWPACTPERGQTKGSDNACRMVDDPDGEAAQAAADMTPAHR